jgi:hypothetical protein
MPAETKRADQRIHGVVDRNRLPSFLDSVGRKWARPQMRSTPASAFVSPTIGSALASCVLENLLVDEEDGCRLVSVVLKSLFESTRKNQVPSESTMTMRRSRRSHHAAHSLVSRLR